MKIRHLAAAALALGLSACSAEYSGVSIYALCSLPAPDGTSGLCTYPAACDGALANTPVLDAATAALDFRLPVEIRNLLADNSNAANGLVNTNDAHIQSFEMTYQGDVAIPTWSVNANVTVPVAGSAGALLRLIPVQYFETIRPASPAAIVNLVVNVRAHGVLGSAQSFSTAWFQVPVQVCDGCMTGSYCAPGSTLASCPSSAPGSTSPGQTAATTCIAAQ